MMFFLLYLKGGDYVYTNKLSGWLSGEKTQESSLLNAFIYLADTKNKLNSYEWPKS